MPDQAGFKRVAVSKAAPGCGRLMAVIVLAATLAVSVAATGCGSSKKTSSTTSTPALSKAQFLAQGNAICTAGNQRLSALQKALEKTFGNRAPSAAQITTYVNTTFVPIIQSQIDKLKALGAPASEQAKVTNLLDLAQADLNKVKSNPKSLVAERHPFADFARQAHAYGLASCATNA